MNNVNNKLMPYDYVLIQSFMINKYHLHGVDLMVYAIIDGFSQAPNQWFVINDKDGTDYIQAWTGLTALEISISLQNLVKQRLIEHKAEITEDDRIIHRYRTI